MAGKFEDAVDFMRPDLGDGVDTGAEDSSSPPPTSSFGSASRDFDLDGAASSGPSSPPFGSAQLLLATFGEHRDIVPCFKALRLILGLVLEAPLPTTPGA